MEKKLENMENMDLNDETLDKVSGGIVRDAASLSLARHAVADQKDMPTAIAPDDPNNIIFF